MNITMTGVPIAGCSECGFRHPVTRQHCAGCGLATIFGHEACKSFDVEAEL